MFCARCSCGNQEWKQVNYLNKGISKCCRNCLNKRYISKETGEIDVSQFFKTKCNQIKRDAPKRNKVSKFPLNITPEYLHELYNQNKKCALSGIDISIDINKPAIKQNISIDRIDSNKGYIIGNIQLVDKRINLIKQELSQEEFIELFCKVAEQNGYIKCDKL